MFRNTQPFKLKSYNKRFRLNTGIQVPKDAVNLAHYYIPPLSSDENIIIGDNSSFIIENIHQPQEELMYVDKDYKLKDYKTITDANVESELVQVTDKFHNDVPLYYRHRLKYLFYGDRTGLDGTYYGDSIVITDVYNNKLPSSYHCKIVLEQFNLDAFKGVTSEKHNNLYVVYVYTSFQIENNFQVKCVYNAVELDDSGFLNIRPNLSENINPQVFFTKAASIMEAITSDNKYYIQKSSEQIKSSVIYTKGVFKDPRRPQLIRVSVEVTFDDDTTETIFFPNVGEEPIKLFNKSSTMSNDIVKFIGERQIISEKPIKHYASEKNIVSIKASLTEADRDIENISLYVKPDGTGCLLAETTIDTGSTSGIPDKYHITKDNDVLTGYSVKFKDRNPIKLLNPRDTGVLDSWYIRVQSGRFTVTEGDNKYHYFIPEYYAQHFDKEYGYPYLSITKEIPKIISNKSIKVKNTPLFVSLNDKFEPNNMLVYRYDGLGRKWPIKIDNWNDKDGIINLTDFISENDDIYIDYVFEEQSLIYTGYVHRNTKNLDNHILLDCNPNKHHYISSMKDDEIIDVPTFSLIDKIIYVYMKPAVIEESGSRIYQEQVLMHTIEELDEAIVNKEHLKLIGSIYIRPNSSFYSLATTDTRTRGGGLLTDISDSVRKELEPESDYYWDIGYWDGEPYQENAVILVRLDRRILKQFGGRFSEEQVQKAVEKHVAFGVLVLVEYVTTYTEEDMKINNLEITIEPTNKLHYKPEMFLSVDLNLGQMLLNVEVFDDMMPPEFDLEVFNPVPKPEFSIVGVLEIPSIIDFTIEDDKWQYKPVIISHRAVTPLEDGYVPAFAGYTTPSIGKWFKPEMTYSVITYKESSKVKIPEVFMSVFEDRRRD